MKSNKTIAAMVAWLTECYWLKDDYDMSHTLLARYDGPLDSMHAPISVRKKWLDVSYELICGITMVKEMMAIPYQPTISIDLEKSRTKSSIFDIDSLEKFVYSMRNYSAIMFCMIDSCLAQYKLINKVELKEATYLFKGFDAYYPPLSHRDLNPVIYLVPQKQTMRRMMISGMFCELDEFQHWHKVFDRLKKKYEYEFAQLKKQLSIATPEQVIRYAQLSWMLYEEYDHAEQALKELLQRDPSYSQAYFVLALMNMHAKNDLSAAIEALNQAIKLESNNTEYVFLLYRCIWQLTDSHEMAVPYLVKAYKNNKGSPLVSIAFAQHLITLKQWEHAKHVIDSIKISRFVKKKDIVDRFYQYYIYGDTAWHKPALALITRRVNYWLNEQNKSTQLHKESLTN